MNTMFKNPNADINEYYLIIYPDVPPKVTEGYVGYIGNRSNEKIHIKIEIDTTFMREKNYRTICLYVDEVYEECVIVMTADFFDYLRSNECMNTSIWHEVGHFHLNHYFDHKVVGGSSYLERKEYFEKGEIMPIEWAADLFALYYMNKEDVIEDFNWLIKTRRNLRWEPEESRVIGVRELCMRKKKIKSLDDSDESIRKKLCELCGKDDFLSL